jgi:adenosylcobinamide kinase/adenosylcobinamide-phosphate guanylyltransferase
VRAVEVEVRGSGGAGGWPEAGCSCASCRGAVGKGERRAPFQLVVDGVLELAPGPAGLAGRLGFLGSVVPAGYRVRELDGGWEVTGPDGIRLLAGTRPQVPPGTRYDVVVLDLGSEPSQLGWLRARGAVTDGTLVLAGFAGHQVRSGRELARRCQIWRAILPRDGDTFTVPGPPGLEPAGPRAQRVLVLGGSGSGKSAEAELRLAAEPSVTYVATGPRPGPDDAEWAARVGAHRERRPAWWRTVETGTEPAALARELARADGAVLVDSVTTWLAAAMDECGAWDGSADAAGRLAGLVSELLAAWRQTRGYVVAVSDEVGLSVVPPARAGRIFRDELGSLNQRLAADADDFVMMVAGRRLITAD